MSSLFCGAPVVVAYDAALVTPQVSLDWVLACGIRTAGTLLTGTLDLPSNAGGYTTVLSGVSVVASLPVDLVLGAVWATSLSSTSPGISVRLCDGWFSLAARPSRHSLHAVPASSSDSDIGTTSCSIPPPLDLPSAFASGYGTNSEGRAFACDPPRTFASGSNSEGRAFACDPPRTFASGSNSEGRAFACDPPRTFVSGSNSEGRAFACDPPRTFASGSNSEGRAFACDPPQTFASGSNSDYNTSDYNNIGYNSGYSYNMPTGHDVPMVASSSKSATTQRPSAPLDIELSDLFVSPSPLVNILSGHFHVVSKLMSDHGIPVLGLNLELLSGVLNVSSDRVLPALSAARSELVSRHGVSNPISGIFSEFSRLTKPAVISLAALHGLEVSSLLVGPARDIVMDHFARGDCGLSTTSGSIGCASVVNLAASSGDSVDANIHDHTETDFNDVKHYLKGLARGKQPVNGTRKTLTGGDKTKKKASMRTSRSALATGLQTEMKRIESVRSQTLSSELYPKRSFLLLSVPAVLGDT
ncbi:hypothetical protein R3P38DRAFT_2815276 [Favolaschia claudopus]|uniref:Uncharacterized protein n=1 Tax=Favolaschia claudopus TaxID=2862362 RepID=A0AAV9Z1G0_9AGAR